MYARCNIPALALGFAMQLWKDILALDFVMQALMSILSSAQTFAMKLWKDILALDFAMQALMSILSLAQTFAMQALMSILSLDQTFAMQLWKDILALKEHLTQFLQTTLFPPLVGLKFRGYSWIISIIRIFYTKFFNEYIMQFIIKIFR